MEKQQTILKKYESLVMEWNTVSLVCAISFGATFLGLIIGLVYNSIYAIFVSMVVMLVFAAFEYKTRRAYARIKETLEDEMFGMAGIKKPKVRELIKKGMWY